MACGISKIVDGSNLTKYQDFCLHINLDNVALGSNQKCSKLAEPIAATSANTHKCISGESMLTYVNLIDSEFKPSLSRQKARTSTAQPSGRSSIKIVHKNTSSLNEQNFFAELETNVIFM